MTNKSKHTIFEQRRALEEFEKAVNDPAFFNRLCDDLNIYGNFPSALPYLDRLIDKFSNVGAPEDEESGILPCLMGAIKRREPRQLTFLAREWHDPNSQLDNEEFIEHCRKVANNQIRVPLQVIK